MKRLGSLLLPSVVMLGVTGIFLWPAPTIAGLPITGSTISAGTTRSMGSAANPAR